MVARMYQRVFHPRPTMQYRENVVREWLGRLSNGHDHQDLSPPPRETGPNRPAQARHVSKSALPLCPSLGIHATKPGQAKGMSGPGHRRCARVLQHDPSDRCRRPLPVAGAIRHIPTKCPPCSGDTVLHRRYTALMSKPLNTSHNVSASARGFRALNEFFRLEAAGGIMLIAAAVLAMVAANSPLAASYDSFRDLPVRVSVSNLEIDKPLLLWINDGMMAVFFLLVALEIKREALSGQLASREQLMLPMVCAVAGVVVPALLFTAFNHANPEAMRGWAVPVATDIAFALGVLALLGSRVPTGMKLLLSTIAVVDDLLAILIIALLYSHDLSLVALAWAATSVAAMWLLNRHGVTRLTPYLILGVALWICVLKSGVHATLAGVITGLMVPHTQARGSANEESAHSPLGTLEHWLHPWVAYAILPLFAFANAGLEVGGLSMSDMLAPLPMGVVVGLSVGKPVGIVTAAVFMRAMGWARLPEGMDLRAVIGLGMMCGIGFTMSLFIDSLAYQDVKLYEEAVLGVLVGSLLSALVGFAWLRATLPAPGMSRSS